MCMNPLHFFQSKFMHDEEKIMKSVSKPSVMMKSVSDVFYNILQASLKDLTLHYMDTDSFILSYSKGKVSDEHMDLSNLDIPKKTNNKVPGKFNHKLGSGIIEEFIALSPKTYSFKNYPKNTKKRNKEA